jgi:hypothetical protein
VKYCMLYLLNAKDSCNIDIKYIISLSECTLERQQLRLPTHTGQSGFDSQGRIDSIPQSHRDRLSATQHECNGRERGLVFHLLTL